ncbi:MAG: cytochrome c biogenesis protein CcsA, partial [Opitutaceae bacterium]
LTLLKFTHDVYPGTDIPKNFASIVRLRSDDGRDDRRVRIFMNNPLRYGGRALYQAGFDNNDRTSVLQVVRNPSWRLPYLACGLIALGLVVQFGLHLWGFLRPRRKPEGAPGRETGPVSRKPASPSPGLDSGQERGDLAMNTVFRRLGPWSAFGIALIWTASTLAPARRAGAFDVAAFGRIPVLAEGRVKPIDTVARTSLLMFQGRQALAVRSRDVSPEEWLLDVLYRPAVADAYPCFRIDNADLLSIFSLTAADGVGGVRFSFLQLESGTAELQRQSQLAEPVAASARTAFQRAVLNLDEHLEYYTRLKYGLEPPGESNLFTLLTSPERSIDARAAFSAMDTYSPVRAIPPAPGRAADAWETAGRGFSDFLATRAFDPVSMTYARIGAAWRQGDPERFNEAVRALQAELNGRAPHAVVRARWEARFNSAEPFYTSLVLYVAAFVLAVLSWLRPAVEEDADRPAAAWPGALARSAFHLMALAFVLATAGIAARMWLEGRPPVTNLYSSALFIGWGAAGLCLLLERLHRTAVASAAGSLIGFGTLVIAHHLSLSGDTMEMMRAVLDSNFWLSTHVVTVTAGYAATFLAGFLAVLYIVRGTLTRSLDGRTARSLDRMVYGTVCFATLFSFVGTVLGGIWADQSWGRFWGWDPKENGALIIVIWNALILHVRWAGLARSRGLMALAVFGNVVTAWSWFGTNMLGVGRHSYGFTEAGFRGLVVFVAAQLAIILLAAVPAEKWRSRAALQAA